MAIKGVISLPLPLNDPDFALTWPKDVFVDEFRFLMSSGSAIQMELLMLDAFASPNVGEIASAEIGNMQENQDGSCAANSIPMFRELDSRLAELSEKTNPRPYFHQKKQVSSLDDRQNDVISLRTEFVRLIRGFDQSGYLDRAFDKDCVDHPRLDPSDKLEELLGIPGIWPLTPESWSEDTTFSLMEVFYDLVARPRSISRYHSYADCGAHYKDFATNPGQALYSAQLNELLDRYGHPYRISTTGPDAGRLVIVSDTAREELVYEAVVIEDEYSTRIRHAISLFRSRTASREDKQSAIVVLAKILETERKFLTKKGLPTKDENALFEIANKFDIRHSNQQQLTDYRNGFLDWIFWWYLATVDLVRSLKDEPENRR